MSEIHGMITLREAKLPDDLAALATLDTAFETNKIYQVLQDGLSFRLAEAEVKPPLRKVYDISDQEEWNYAVIAESCGTVAGFAAAEYQQWNRRAVIWHLYVSPDHRRLGIATQLLTALNGFAKSAGARCLWLETQNVNYPAIQFYLRSGFRLCGLDDTLYDPEAVDPQEVALYFTRSLE